MGIYHKQDGVTLYHGDNVQTMRESIPDASIDLVVTSPPYDNLRTYGGHTWDFEGLAAELWRAIKPGGVVVWVVADATVDGSETGTSFRQALHFKEIGFRLADTMIWEKTGQGAVGAWYWSNFEYMFVLAKGKPRVFNPIEDRKNVVDRGKVATCGAGGSPVVGRQRGPSIRTWAPLSERVAGLWTRPFGCSVGLAGAA